MTASISAEPDAATSVAGRAAPAYATVGVPAHGAAAAVLTPVPDVPVRRKRGRPRDPEADGRILEAAASLILEHGFDRMTVDDVASRAKVGKATVYRRWAKKEDLALAAMGRLYDNSFPVPDTGSAREDLRQRFASAIDFVNSEAGLAYSRTCVAESSRDERVAALYRSANDQSEAGIRQIFERGIMRGEIRPDINIGAAVQLITGILTLRNVCGTEMPLIDEVDSLVDLVMHGTAS